MQKAKTSEVWFSWQHDSWGWAGGGWWRGGRRAWPGCGAPPRSSTPARPGPGLTSQSDHNPVSWFSESASRREVARTLLASWVLSPPGQLWNIIFEGLFLYVIRQNLLDSSSPGNTWWVCRLDTSFSCSCPRHNYFHQLIINILSTIDFKQNIYYELTNTRVDDVSSHGSFEETRAAITTKYSVMFS